MHSKDLFLFFTFVLLVTCCTFEAHPSKPKLSKINPAKHSNVFHLVQASPK